MYLGWVSKGGFSIGGRVSGPVIKGWRWSAARGKNGPLLVPRSDNAGEERRQRNALANRPLINRSSIFEDRRDCFTSLGPTRWQIPHKLRACQGRTWSVTPSPAFADRPCRYILPLSVVLRNDTIIPLFCRVSSKIARRSHTLAARHGKRCDYAVKDVRNRRFNLDGRLKRISNLLTSKVRSK